jgi:hypothetical protein
MSKVLHARGQLHVGRGRRRVLLSVGHAAAGTAILSLRVWHSAAAGRLHRAAEADTVASDIPVFAVANAASVHQGSATAETGAVWLPLAEADAAAALVSVEAAAHAAVVLDGCAVAYAQAVRLGVAKAQPRAVNPTAAAAHATLVNH